MIIILQFFDILQQGLSGHVVISSDCDTYMNFAAFWTFFGLLEIEERIDFSEWWREKWSTDIYFPDEFEVSSLI